MCIFGPHKQWRRVAKAAMGGKGCDVGHGDHMVGARSRHQWGDVLVVDVVLSLKPYRVGFYGV
jgi:hypothetical protein